MTKSPTKRTEETQPDESATTEQPKKLEEIRIVKKEFSFALNEADFATKAKRIAELRDQLDSAEHDLEIAKGRFKAAESRLSADIAHEIACIRNKHEMREVECEQVHDFVRKVVFWRFDDTVLAERAMEQQERQAKLPLKDKPGEAPETDAEPANFAPGATSEGDSAESATQTG